MDIFKENYINSPNNSFPANQEEDRLVGSDLKEWNRKKENISQHHVKHRILPLDWEGMVNQTYDLKQKNVYYPQFDPRNFKKFGIYDPETVTFEDIRNHAIIRQDKSAEGTVKKLMNYLGKMETHPIYPINFNKLDWEQYFRYMDYIKVNGDLDRFGNLKPVGIHGLLNRDEAWLMYLKTIGYEDFFPRYRNCLDKNKIKQASQNDYNKPIPTAEIVHKMLRHEYVSKKEFDRNYSMLKDKGIRRRDLNKYIQYQFFFGFFIGMAFEKEHVIITLDDVIDRGIDYCIRITRPKVGNKKRILRLEQVISKSPVHKSMENYLTKILPKFAEKGEKAFSVNPKTGRMWGYDLVEKHDRKNPDKIIEKGCSQLRGYMTRWGKQVYPQFYPYLMRHWCGTARMIEWDKKGSAFERVNLWMGHSDPKDTKIYCQLTRLWEDDDGSWLSRALKQDWLGGLDGSKNSSAQQKQNTQSVAQNNGRDKKEFPQARILDTY